LRLGLFELKTELKTNPGANAVATVDELERPVPMPVIPHAGQVEN